MPPKNIEKLGSGDAFGFILFPFRGSGVGTLISFILLDYDKFNNGHILSSACG